MSAAIIVGAYAAAFGGTPGADRGRLIREVLASEGVTGLELPFFGTEIEPWLDEGTTAPSVLTLIPALFGAGRRDPAIGLASTDTDGRSTAVTIAEQARLRTLARNTEHPGAIVAVELHSSGGAGSAAAFARSLDELAGRDWGGAELLIEHCDAVVPGRAAQKGFLPLEDELAIATSRGLGVVINWGRSVIEHRHADGAERHLRAALDAGLLAGLVLSGAAAVDSEYGPAWSDGHPPPAHPGFDGLLTAERIASAVALARRSERLRFLGVKYSVAPSDGDDERIALLRRGVAALWAA